jgi:hypothetical protein
MKDKQMNFTYTKAVINQTAQEADNTAKQLVESKTNATTTIILHPYADTLGHFPNHYCRYYIISPASSFWVVLPLQMANKGTYADTAMPTAYSRLNYFVRYSTESSCFYLYMRASLPGPTPM